MTAGRVSGQVTTLGKVIPSYHPCAFITRQYNLVLAKGQWRSAAGKVTIGVEFHLQAYWPHLTYSLDGHSNVIFTIHQELMLV